jgi:trans-aconitate methyltransferase
MVTVKTVHALVQCPELFPTSAIFHQFTPDMHCGNGKDCQNVSRRFPQALTTMLHASNRLSRTKENEKRERRRGKPKTTRKTTKESAQQERTVIPYLVIFVADHKAIQ